MPAEDDWLSPAETLRLHRFQIAKRRNDWRLGRWTAKSAVGRLLNVPAGAVEIHAAPDGAPEVHVSPPIAISLSHSAGRAICAVSLSAVSLGCDIESIEPRSEAFISDYFTTREQSLFKQASQEDRSTLATLLWSAKESALKALREGLRLDTRSVEVTLVGRPCQAAAGRWHSLTASGPKSHTFQGWCQRTENLVRTIVAYPPPTQPQKL